MAYTNDALSEEEPHGESQHDGSDDSLRSYTRQSPVEVARQPDRRQGTSQQCSHDTHVNVSLPGVEQACRGAQNGSEENARSYEAARIRPI